MSTSPALTQNFCDFHMQAEGTLASTAKSSTLSNTASRQASGAKKLPQTASGLVSTLGMSTQLKTRVALSSSAHLDVTSRRRGPQPYDLRPGARPREEIDLSEHLIEHAAPRVMADVDSQTDALLPRPVTPPYQPAKTGVDAETQCEHGTAEWLPPQLAGAGTERLFRFDDAVDPLVAMLSDAILEQAERETGHEAQLQALAARRETVETVLQLDKAREQEIIAAAQAAADRKARIVSDARASYDRQMSAIAKVAAQAMAKGVAGSGWPAVFSVMRSQGLFRDPAVAAVTERVLPAVYGGLRARLEADAAARSVLEGAVADALTAGMQAYASRVEAEAKEKEERERKHYIRVFVRLPRREGDAASSSSSEAEGGVEVQLDADGANVTVLVGPVLVQKLDSIAVVESRIHEWLAAHKAHKMARRVVVMAGGPAKPLQLFLNGARMPPDARLLDTPLDQLGGLELRPQNGWDTSAPDEEEAAS